jgi:eukaryotic-like serine/threonine-protein kinase
VLNRMRQQLGNYRLVRLIGRSAFADIYFAEHIFLGTEVAIKVLRVDLSEADMESLLSAARTLTTLEHPNIIRVLEVGRGTDLGSDFPFLVMEFAPNGTLRRLHSISSRLPLRIILVYVRHIAEALQYAHLQGFVHCDVKPENILLGSGYQVLLSDFSTGLLSPFTKMMTGTEAYMAPEQIRGQPLPNSDEYALGVMVYEWLSGELPFSGSLREIADQHQFAPPPPLREKIPEISPAVEEVVLTALAKDPQKRFGNLLAFANALEQASLPEEQYLNISLASTMPLLPTAGLSEVLPSPAGNALDEPPAAFYPGTLRSFRRSTVNPRSAAEIYRPFTRPISRRAMIVGLPVLVVAGGGFLAWLLNQRESSPTTALNPMLLAYHGHAGAVTAVAWSPNGSYIVSGGDDHTIRVWRAKTGADVFISHGHSGGVPAVTWSSDSRRIASASAGPSTSGGPPAGNNAVQVWYATTGKPIYNYHGHSSGITGVAWAPGKERIASASTDYTVQVWEATTGQHPLIYRTHPWYVWTVAWSPDGTRIASGGPDGIIQLWDAVTGHTLAVYRGHSNGVEALTWSPDGTRIASASDDKTVRVWDVFSGTSVYTYRGHAGYVHTVSWSPDGFNIASGSSDKTVQVWNVATGKTIYTYRGHSGRVTTAVWSPDSQYIASGSEDGTVQVWQVV